MLANQSRPLTFGFTRPAMSAIPHPTFVAAAAAVCSRLTEKIVALGAILPAGALMGTKECLAGQSQLEQQPAFGGHWPNTAGCGVKSKTTCGCPSLQCTDSVHSGLLK